MLARVCATLVLLPLVLVAGCRHVPRTEDEARACVDDAAAQKSGVALYRCLDQRTRWAVESAYRDQSVMRSLISARYSEDTAAAALAPLAAATEPDAPHYFEVVMGADPLRGAPTRHYHGRYADKWWGLTDLGDEWTQRQEHADHELKTVRENLKLLDKAESK